MQQNPYESPSEGDVRADGIPRRATGWNRPFGISMLGPLIVLFGIHRLFSTLMTLLVVSSQGTGSGSLLPVSTWASVGFPTVLGLAYIVTGGGLWNGRQWSWWLTCIGLTIFIGVHLASLLELAGGSPQELMLRGRLGIRILFAVLGVGYLMTGKVLSSFRLEALHPTGRRIPLAMSCAMIVAGVAALIRE